MSIKGNVENEVVDIHGSISLVLKGDDGESAYEVAVRNGFVGTEEEWLASLKGEADRAEAATAEALVWRNSAKGYAVEAGNHEEAAKGYRNECQTIKDGIAPQVTQAISAIQAEKAEAEAKKVLVDETAAQAHLDKVQADADAAEVRYLRSDTIIQKNVATDAAERARLYAEGASTAGYEAAQQALATKLDVDGTAVNSEKVNGLTVETAVPANAVFTDTTYHRLTAEEAAEGTATTARAITAKVLADYVADVVATAVTSLVNSSPATLDTLKELADAIGEDPNFATTMTNALAEKLGKNETAKNAEKVNNLTVQTAVPANAVFTDTTYTPASATPLANGTAAVGTSAKYAREDHVHPLQTSVSGSSGSCTGNAATATNAAKVNNHTVNSDVPSGAKFTDTTYSNATTSASGLMPAADKVKVNNIVHSAEAHNGIFRGKDLTSYFDGGQMSTDIANGKFDDIYIGDYIIKTINLPAITYTDKAGVEQTQAAQTFTNVKWYVAAIDPYIHCGDTETTAHHVLLIPASTLQRNVKMNPTNDTSGAYIGSDMWRVHIPNWATAIKAAFGDAHVLKHREILSNTADSEAPSGAGGDRVGAASNWAWTDVEVNIPNEQMVYGGRVWGSALDCGDFPRILPLYALKCNSLDDRSWFWLRVVAYVSTFAVASDRGYVSAFGASSSTGYGGVRPYFLAR